MPRDLFLFPSPGSEVRSSSPYCRLPAEKKKIKGERSTKGGPGGGKKLANVAFESVIVTGLGCLKVILRAYPRPFQLGSNAPLHIESPVINHTSPGSYCSILGLDEKM